MTKKLPSLTIGIPAYNEEKNIANLLDSIYDQVYQSVRLKQVVIICDGCSDNTIKIVKRYKKHYLNIKIVTSSHRSGKASALNKIYDLSNSDYLMTIDADVVFMGKKSIDKMAKAMINNSRLNMVGPSHMPTTSHTLFGNLSRVSALLFLDAVSQYNHGSNFYSCMSVEFMRKSFYKSYRFPAGTIADQCYAYGQSIKNNHHGFKLIKGALVIFGVAQTFHDWRVLSVRSTIGDKSDTIKHFGNSVLPLYTIPRELLIRSTLKWLLKSPIYCVGAVIMNLFIRIFPYNHKVENGVWEMVESSKELYL